MRTPGALEEIHDVLGRDVARRAGRVGTAAEAAERRVEGAHARLVAGLHVGERASLGVVQVERDALERRSAPATARTSSRTWAGWPTPIVSPSEISSAPSASSRRTTSIDRGGRDGALVRAAADGRDVGAQQHAVGARALRDRTEALEVFGDAAIHVLAVVGLARRHEERRDRQRRRRASRS